MLHLSPAPARYLRELCQLKLEAVPDLLLACQATEKVTETLPTELNEAMGYYRV